MICTGGLQKIQTYPSTRRHGTGWIKNWTMQSGSGGVGCFGCSFYCLCPWVLDCFGAFKEWGLLKKKLKKKNTLAQLREIQILAKNIKPSQSRICGWIHPNKLRKRLPIQNLLRLKINKKKEMWTKLVTKPIFPKPNHAFLHRNSRVLVNWLILRLEIRQRQKHNSIRTSLNLSRTLLLFYQM